MNELQNTLELWGGVECTLNRVGDVYRDQLVHNGHATRVDDLDRFHALGIRTLRVAVLWERTAPTGLDKADWTWPDQMLGRMRALDIRPIVGLVHHGSGPRGTRLDDAGFVSGLAEFAAAVARRYPWVDHYTPVNEPLTTARFSGLCGVWYPHARDERAFVRMLLHQCQATKESMRAIRSLNPAAKLVQTEDLGKCHGTPPLRYQIDFENERRWVTLDLLCGLLDRQRRMWHHLRAYDISQRELAEFVDEPCPPDIAGFNYYVTSERFIDHRLERYPAWTHGGNGRDRYADVEAVRVLPRGLDGLRALLREAHARFSRPLAATEIHLGCHREAQMRWLVDAWRDALALRRDGIDMRAITLWSLLGAFDWNSLVTEERGFYEPGAFDVRSQTPRPTALTSLARQLTKHEKPKHPVLDVPGWWKRPSRLIYRARGSFTTTRKPGRGSRPILITGSNGTLGSAFKKICRMRGLSHVALARDQLNIVDELSIAQVLGESRPWAVVNTAGYVRVDAAEDDRERCRRINVEGAQLLAAACRARNIRLVTFSTDLVFDGQRGAAYLEEHEVAPLNVYGRTKADAEVAVLGELPQALVVRTSAFFGPWDRANFIHQTLAQLGRDEEVLAAEDWIVSPTYVPDLVHACLDLLIDGVSGIWHLANAGQTTWAEFARRAARRLGFDRGRIIGVAGAELGYRARRPACSALASQHGVQLPPLDCGIDRFFADWQYASDLAAC